MAIIQKAAFEVPHAIQDQQTRRSFETMHTQLRKFENLTNREVWITVSDAAPTNEVPSDTTRPAVWYVV